MGEIRNLPPTKRVEHRTFHLIRHSGFEVMRMNGMVHLPLTQSLPLPIKSMLPPPQDGPGFKIRQVQFLPQFSSQGLMDSFAWLNPSTRSDPERTHSGQTDSQQKNSFVRS